MNLFDIIDREVAKENPELCQHLVEKETFTIWEGETTERMTWTCEMCGSVRGRVSFGYQKPKSTIRKEN